MGRGRGEGNAVDVGEDWWGGVAEVRNPLTQRIFTRHWTILTVCENLSLIVQVARLVGGPTVEELSKRIEDLQRLH